MIVRWSFGGTLSNSSSGRGAASQVEVGERESRPVGVIEQPTARRSGMTGSLPAKLWRRCRRRRTGTRRHEGEHHRANGEYRSSSKRCQGAHRRSDRWSIVWRRGMSCFVAQPAKRLCQGHLHSARCHPARNFTRSLVIRRAVPRRCSRFMSGEYFTGSTSSIVGARRRRSPPHETREYRQPVEYRIRKPLPAMPKCRSSHGCCRRRRAFGAPLTRPSRREASIRCSATRRRRVDPIFQRSGGWLQVSGRRGGGRLVHGSTIVTQAWES